MHIKVVRHTHTPLSTTGDLYVDGELLCHTLEDPVREIGPNGEGKIWGATAIPPGTYKVEVSWSPKFQRLMPRVMDVPHFSGILIHKGNTPENSLGCVLVGMAPGEDCIGQSSIAFNLLWPKLLDATDAKEPITLEIG